MPSYLAQYKSLTHARRMTLASWYASRNTVPKYLFYCTCEKNHQDSSELAIFDLWSFAHVFWGMVYSLPLAFDVSPFICMISVVAIAILYELFENSSTGIWLASKLCCTANYQGDNFWNSVADITCCLIGYCLALCMKLFS